MMYLRPLGGALVLCFALAPLSEGYAQGMFLEKGMSGFGISGGLFTQDDYYGADLSVGYSINGVIDVGISGGRARFNGSGRASNDVWGWTTGTRASLHESKYQQAVALDAYAAVGSNTPIVYPTWVSGKFSGRTISPSTTVHLLKQSRWAPVSLAVSGAYEATTYYGDAVADERIESRGFSFGAAVYRSFTITERLSATTEIGFLRRSGALDYTEVMSVPRDFIPIEPFYPPPDVYMVPFGSPTPTLVRIVEQQTYREYHVATHFSYTFLSGFALHLSPSIVYSRGDVREVLSLGFTAPRSFLL